MKTDKTTPRPWKLKPPEVKDPVSVVVQDFIGTDLFRVWRGHLLTKEDADETAALIVKAVNHYDELVEMLHLLVLTFDEMPRRDHEQEAILALSFDSAKQLLTKLKEDEQ